MSHVRCLSVVFLFPYLATSLYADHFKKYFPLKVGNKWVTRGSEPESFYSFDPATLTTSIPTASGNTFTLKGFPRSYGDPMKVRFAGSTLYVFADSPNSSGQFVPFLRFGAPVGTQYLMPSGLKDWGGRKFTVHAKDVKVKNTLLGKTFSPCIRFRYGFSNWPYGETGEFSFARDVGLVAWDSLGGSAFPLMAYSNINQLKRTLLNGKWLGRLHVVDRTVDSGQYSEHPSHNDLQDAKNQVLIFNDETTWKEFFKKHKPTFPVPWVSFYDGSLIAVMAGGRPTGGYTIKVQSVGAEVFSSLLTVKVKETFTGGTGGPTSPYQFVFVDEKISAVSVKWITLP